MPAHTPAPVSASMVSTGPLDLYRVTSSAFSSTSIVAGATATVLLPTYGYTAMFCSCFLTDASLGTTVNGTLSLQRYTDLAGKVVQGAAKTVSLGALTPSLANLLDDGSAFQSVAVTIANTGGVAAVLSQFELGLYTPTGAAGATLSVSTGTSGPTVVTGSVSLVEAEVTPEQLSVGEALNLILRELKLHTAKFNEIFAIPDADDQTLREDQALIN